MCGILGGYGKQINDFVKSNLHNLSRRGPDNQGFIGLDNGLVFGATRLAMTDPEPRSNQPMIDESNGNMIVFNGEIYNYKFIKKNLISKGIKFFTESDTEVLLKAINYYGSSFVYKLEGMFAFAMYHRVNNKVILARDFLGKKPLYFHKSENQFYFSSQIDLIKKALVGTSIDNESLMTFLRVGYLIDPSTMYNEINSLAPGSVLEINLSSNLISSSFNFVPDAISNPKNLSINESVNEAILERIDGHNKFAISLSGGVDSTIIALELSKIDRDCQVYSMRWSDSDKNSYNFDHDSAQKIAAQLKLPFNSVEMGKVNDIPSLLTRYLQACGEPNSSPTGLSMMALYSQMASDGIKLALTGDGADEVFGGYARYSRVSRIRDFPQLNFQFIKRAIASKMNDSNIMSKLLISLIPTDSEEYWLYFQQLASSNRLFELTGTNPIFNKKFSSDILSQIFNPSNDRVSSLMFRDLRLWLAMESNKKLDSISMWNSIEARSPFQSENVIGIGYKHMSNHDFKILNKKLLIDDYPEVSKLPINRKKLGFISPLGHWLRNNPILIQESIEHLHKNLNFDKNLLVELGESPKLREYENFRFLWSLIVLSKWHQIFYN